MTNYEMELIKKQARMELIKELISKLEIKINETKREMSKFSSNSNEYGKLFKEYSSLVDTQLFIVTECLTD